jgi:uncharacterized protein YlxW (UPF0749 family)
MSRTRMQLMVSLTVVSMVLGFMVALQYQQVESRRKSDSDLTVTADTEQSQLRAELATLERANKDALVQLSKINAELSSFEERSAGSNDRLKRLQARLERERILAGTTAVTGPGISITIMDGTGPDAEQVLTHDWDVRSVINELFTAGAEAVSINGYRVVATSGIFCTGPVVRINDHKISAPFVIQAIGDGQTLKSALEAPGMLLDVLRSRGLNVSDPKIETSITMPAFSGRTDAATSDITGG